MSATSTRTAPIWDSAKEPRTKGLAHSVLERSSHARESVVYTTDTNGLHSFRDRALFIYRVWAFISVSACWVKTATHQNKVPPYVREESPDRGDTTFGTPKWCAEVGSWRTTQLHFTDWPLDRVSESGSQAACERNGDLSKEFVS